MGEAMPPGLLNWMIRTVGPLTATTAMPGNVIVSNVRGTPIPLYAAGATIECMYPMSLLAASQGLNITVVTYRGRVDVGFVVDPDLVPDPWVLADAIPAALDELLEAAEAQRLRAA